MTNPVDPTLAAQVSDAVNGNNRLDAAVKAVLEGREDRPSTQEAARRQRATADADKAKKVAASQQSFVDAVETALAGTGDAIALNASAEGFAAHLGIDAETE